MTIDLGPCDQIVLSSSVHFVQMCAVVVVGNKKTIYYVQCPVHDPPMRRHVIYWARQCACGNGPTNYGLSHRANESWVQKEDPQLKTLRFVSPSV